ncbi:MAG: type 1 glutamine amidotransferase [Thermoleophilia bacterium]|nr:type 1 glutamine amidotransferase [Thermoleophilia bacterium]
MSRPVVHCIQHAERVRPLTVADWAAERDVDFRVIRIDEGEELPDPTEVERLVVLGGGMNTDQSDEHPWIDLERAWLRRAIELDRAEVLGICLGSQLLAEVLGGTVGRAEVPEIGWVRIELTEAGLDDRVFGALPPTFDAMQWHGDAWTLPPDAQLAATSSGCSTQAFVHGARVRAVQFHPEFTHARSTQLAATTTDDLTPRGCIQSPEQFLADPARFDALREVCLTLLDRAFLAVD